MKISISSALVAGAVGLCIASTSAQSQTTAGTKPVPAPNAAPQKPTSMPTTFDELIKQAQAEAKAKQLAQAAEHFHAAAAVAPDNLKKLASFLDAGRVYIQAGEGAKAESEFKNGIALPGLTAVQTDEVNRLLGQAQATQGKFLEASGTFEKVAKADSPHYTVDLFNAAQLIDQAQLSPDKTPKLVSAAERIYPRLMSSPIFDEAKKESRARNPEEAAVVKLRWAQSLGRLGASSRAAALLGEIGGSAQLKSNTRYNAYVLMANEQIKSKQFDGALATWDKVAALPDSSFARQRERAYGRANVFVAQGDSTKARNELTGLMQNPATTPQTKASTLMDIGQSYKRERDEALKKNDKTTAELNERAAAGAFEHAMNLNDAPAISRVNALLERAQLDVEAGRFDAARRQILGGERTFAGAPMQVLKPLFVGDAKLYRIEKKYVQALTPLESTAHRAPFGATYDPDVQQFALDILSDAYNAKDYAAARSILSTLKSWGLREQQRLFLEAELEIADGKFDAARGYLSTLSKSKLTANEQKHYDELVGKLPK